MAVAHALLYQSDDLADLSVSTFMEKLIHQLHFSTARIGTEIRIDKHFENVSFGLDTAIPLGFMVTEIVSNCLKHAFVGREHGEINVSLTRTADRQFELVVSDNGVGMPEEIDLKQPRSLGLELVAIFADQLHGQVEIARKEGTQVRVRYSGKGRS